MQKKYSLRMAGCFCFFCIKLRSIIFKILYSILFYIRAIRLGSRFLYSITLQSRAVIFSGFWYDILSGDNSVSGRPPLHALLVSELLAVMSRMCCQ